MANYFVDFSAGVDGSGTFASPYNTIVGKTFTSSDSVWCRRKTLSVSSATTISQSCLYIGWPKSGDPYYSTRPSEAQSAWDGDAADYATITNSVVSSTSYTISNNPSIHRFYFLRTGITSGTYNLITCSGNSQYTNCKFVLHETTGAAIQTSGVTLNSFSNCIFEVGAGSYTPSAALNVTAASTIALVNCTFTTTGACNYLINSAALIFTCTGCTFNALAYATSTNFIATSTTTDNSIALFKNCSLYNAGGVGFIGSPLLIVDNCDVQAIKLYIEETNGPMLFKSFTQNGLSDTGAIDMRNTALAVINNLTTVNNNPKQAMYFYAESNTFGKQLCFVRNAVLDSIGPASFGATCGGVGVVQDNNKTLGNWLKTSVAGSIAYSSAVRTGGADLSVKMSPSNNNFMQTLGLKLHEYGLETIYVSLVSGANTITVYGIYSGFTSPPTKETLIIESDYLDTATAHRALVTSISTGALTSDTSTWSISGTVFKLVLSVTTAQSCVSPIRIILTQPQDTAASAVYIDPIPVVS